MALTIKEHVFSCLGAFALLADVSSREPLGEATESPPWLTEECSRKLKNAQSRFKVWSGNIGAHRSGRSSLEYRLRDASNIREHVVELLEGLRQSLEDGRSTNPVVHILFADTAITE